MNELPESSSERDINSRWTMTSQDPWDRPEEDDGFLEMCFKSDSPKFGGVEFTKLFHAGDDVITKFFNGDRSSADYCLAKHLAFFTGKNSERTKRLMFMSNLVRDKWHRREDYIIATVLLACE